MVQLLGEYMWDNYYKPRAEALPDNRYKETIVALKQLIHDMYNSGYNPHQIAKLIRKDHTTVYYHLNALSKNMPPEVSEHNRLMKDVARATRIAQFKEKREERAAKAAQRKFLRAERKAMREAKHTEHVRKQNERSLEVEKQKKLTAERREIAMKLYKKGLTYHQIARELGVLYSYVQGLLQKHPDFRKYNRQQPRFRHNIVQQYDVQGKLLAEYPSTRLAGVAVGGAGNSISLAARGIIKSYKGYIWRYGEMVDPLTFKLEK